jgi:hypothetical protein
MAADKKIPLLTEVYQPKPSAEPAPKPKPRLDDASLITPELIARVTGHVRPRLEAEITQSVLLSVRDALRKDLLQDLQTEIKSAQLALEENTRNFIDKTKADLKTELPQMYQNSADLVFKGLSEKMAALQTGAITNLDTSLTQVTEQSLQVATQALHATVEGLQVETSAQIKHDFNQEMQAFQADALVNHQALLRQEMTDIFEATSHDAKTDLQQQLSALQADALAQMRATFTEAMPSIYSNAIADQQEEIVAQISQNLHQELQAFQTQSISQHQAQLADSIGQHQTLFEQSINSHQTQLTQSLANNFESISATAKEDLAERMRVIQADAAEQMRNTLNAAIPSIYAAAGDDVKAKFADEMTEQSQQMRDNFLATINADLPAVQQVMRENIQQILASALPSLEQDLRMQLTTELEELLLKVKFVLPK